MTKAMKVKSLIVALLILVVVAILAFIFFSENKEGPSQLILYGNVDIRQVDVGFRVFGRVANAYVDEGDELQPGDLLAELDPVPYEAQKKQLEAQVLAMEWELQNAHAVFDRRKTLISSGAISQEDYTNSLSSVEQLAANLAATKAQLESIEVSLADTKLHCPVHSVVLTRIREPGSVLNAGEAIYTLSILSPLWIRTYVSEPDLGLVYPGMAAEVTTDTPGGKVYKGHLGFISPVAEFTPKNVETVALRPNLVYRLRVIVDDPDYSLKRGMPVTIKLLR